MLIVINKINQGLKLSQYLLILSLLFQQVNEQQKTGSSKTFVGHKKYAYLSWEEINPQNSLARLVLICH